jgi:hypothetical protein
MFIARRRVLGLAFLQLTFEFDSTASYPAVVPRLLSVLRLALMENSKSLCKLLSFLDGANRRTLVQVVTRALRERIGDSKKRHERLATIKVAAK